MTSYSYFEPPKTLSYLAHEVGCRRRVYLYNTIISSQHVSAERRSQAVLMLRSGDIIFPSGGFFDYFLFGCTPVSPAYTLSLFCDSASQVTFHQKRRDRFNSLQCEGGKAEKSRQQKKARGRGWAIHRPLPATFIFIFFEKWKGNMERGTFLTVLSFSFCTLTSDLCIEKSICLLGCGTEGLYFS